jgi:hypothetical protein
VLVGGAIAVAVIAGAGRMLGRADVHSDSVATASSRGVEDAVRFVFVLSLIVGIGCTFAVARAGGFSGTSSPGRRTGSSLVRGLVTGLLTVGSLLALIFLLRWLFPEHPAAPARPAGAGPVHVGGTAGQGSLQDWPVVIGLVVVVLLAVAGFAILRRSRRAVARSSPDLGAPAPAAAEVVPPFDADAERDPRRAVVALYHWLQTVLRSHGRGRDEWEAPVEHVERVLAADSDVLAAGRTVADAFELARYSDHEVSETVRADAVTAARAVADHVEGQARGGA